MLAQYHEQNDSDDNTFGLNETTALRYRITKCLYENEKAENEALEGYAELLSDLTGWGMQTEDEDVRAIIVRAIDAVREISSDEKNHRLTLQSLQNDLDRIVITPDGMSVVLENIVNMVGNDES